MAAAPRAVQPVRVVCRLRPDDRGQPPDLTVGADGALVAEGFDQQFRFTQVFGPEASQAEIFAHASHAGGTGLLPALEDGTGAAVLAYGQTGSGKTHTLFGAPTQDEEGLVPRFFRELLDRAATRWRRGRIFIAALELYCDRVTDLLNPGAADPPGVAEGADGPFVRNMLEVMVSNAVEALAVLEFVVARRRTAPTAMNATSSRSHLLLFVRAEREVEGDVVLCPRLTFVDLAGSECVGNFDADDEQGRAEAKSTNASLSALGSVIAALARRPVPAHVPFRDSLLTNLLRTCLGKRAGGCVYAVVCLRQGQPHISRLALLFGRSALQMATEPRKAERAARPAGGRGADGPAAGQRARPPRRISQVAGLARAALGQGEDETPGGPPSPGPPAEPAREPDVCIICRQNLESRRTQAERQRAAAVAEDGPDLQEGGVDPTASDGSAADSLSPEELDDLYDLCTSLATQLQSSREQTAGVRDELARCRLNLQRAKEEARASANLLRVYAGEGPKTD